MTTVGKFTKRYSTFSPRDISGCTLWLDASDPSSVTLSGSNVTGWSNKSGTSYATTFTNNFTYATSVKNSLNAVQTAVGQSMTLSAFPFPSNAGISIFHVYMPIGQSTDSAFIEFGPNVNNTDGFYLRAGNNFNFAIRTNGTVFGINIGGVATSNTWQILGGINKDPNSSNTMAFYTNGTKRVSGQNTTTNMNTSSTLNINVRLQFPTYIGEILIYNVALNNTQRQTIEGYLAWKWGMESTLPLDHPYKNVPFFTYTRP